MRETVRQVWARGARCASLLFSVFGSGTNPKERHAMCGIEWEGEWAVLENHDFHGV